MAAAVPRGRCSEAIRLRPETPRRRGRKTFHHDQGRVGLSQVEAVMEWVYQYMGVNQESKTTRRRFRKAKEKQ
eukprot:269542-Rhodomonas_salina.2